MKQAEPTPATGVLLMLTSVFLFSANTLLLRALSLHLPAADGWLAVLYRGVVGMLVVVALYGFGRGLSLRGLFGNRLVVLRGVVGALTTAAFYLSITHLGASRAVVLSLTYPIFGTIIAAFWIKEHTPLRTYVWMMLGFAGLVVFLGGNATGTISIWDWLSLAGALGAGIVVVTIRKLRNSEHAGTIYGSMCVFCVLLAMPMTGHRVQALPMMGHGGLILAASVVAVSQLLMTNAYRSLPVSHGSSIQMLLPVVTAAGAWFMFGERFTAWEFCGAALTLFATWRVTAGR